MALQKIAAFNGAPLPVALSDVSDHRRSADHLRQTSRQDQADDDSEPQVRTQFGVRRGGYSALPTAEGGDPEAAAGTTASPTTWQDSIDSLKAKYDVLLSPTWRRTTLLTWSIWASVTLAYTMFNVFLPKFLESKLHKPVGGGGASPSPSPSPTEPGSNGDTAVMQDYLLYSLASLPGSLLGSWAIETRLGRKGTMALSLGATGVAILGFIFADSSSAIVATSMAISLTATTSYAAIYGYTPEVFDTDIRGTASGTASALSRFAGIIAPVLAGVLFATSLSAPLVISVFLFVVSVILCIALPIETRGRASSTSPLDGARGEDV